ncbi:MAG: hypothetical protein HRU14_06905 [Planctomycetes bacterium]|nr:hypothetical protein [Planctomycetota bacterium]
MSRRLALALAALCTIASAQVNDAPTHFVWALDSGDQTAPTPIIRIYTPNGRQVDVVDLDLPMIGTGPARALAFDRLGNAYVCRGDLVHQLDRDGNATMTTFAPPAGASKAQDVVETPQGDIMVSWGATAAASAITTYDTAGTLLSNFTDPALDHPRRITSGADPSSTIIYVANRAAQEILAFDPSGVPPTLTVTTDLTTQNIGPVGLCYDNANNDLWVVSSYGQTNEVGCIDLSSNTYATAFSYPPTVPTSAPGLLSPAGATYDRFRRLYLAGRNKNGGTPGVYVFEATGPSAIPVFLAYWPRVGPTPINVIDVAPQPSEQTTCAPMEAVPSGNQFILEMGAVNRVTFSNPATPGVPYIAAMSRAWSTNPCGSPFRQGIIEIPFIQPAAPDVRGVPLKSDDLFWGSVAVSHPISSSLSGPPWSIDIYGFFDTLDATGFHDGYIDLTGFTDPFNILALDGTKIELAWVTFDLMMDPNMVPYYEFGYTSQPLCLVLRNPAASPVTAIPCN